LQTSSGTWVQVSAVQAWTQAATVHNLTVQGVHTFHAAAGSLDVLNHNCDWTSNSNLNNHFDKHGSDMDYESKAEYQYAAEDLVCDCDGLRPGVRSKRDGNTSYYLDEDSGEFGAKSDRGIITYFGPDDPLGYYNRQPGT